MTRTSKSKVIRSFQFKNMFPHDIVVQILLHVSPWDLLQIYRTSRYFRALLDRSQYIWRTARKSLNPPVPEPIVPDNLHHYSRHWTEAAYTNYIFGNNTCSICGNELTEPLLVTSYSLRLFLCSKSKKCRFQRDKDTTFLFESKLPSSELLGLLTSYLPYLEGTGLVRYDGSYLRRYLHGQLSAAEEEWTVAREISNGFRPSADTTFILNVEELQKRTAIRASWLDPYMKTAESLFNWQSRYSAALKAHNVRRRNLKLAKEFACTYRIKFTKVEKSPVFQRVMLNFTRMNGLLTPSAWLSIQSQLEQEEAEQKRRLRLPNGDRKTLTCSRCPQVPRPRYFETDDDLANHIRRKHRIVVISTTGH